MAPSATNVHPDVSGAPRNAFTSERNLKIGGIVLVVLVAAGVIAYLVSNRGGNPETNYEITTASGLKIHDITVGTGESPKMGQTVQVHYAGRLENGSEFDSSRKRGPASPPAQFALGPGLIPAWNEALQTMKVGGKRQLFVPSNLAYGANGRPGIPPNSNLIFEIELLAVK